MGTKLPSYKYKSCCGNDCDYLEVDKNPCWGEVSVVDEVETDDGDWEWIHVCEGHHDYWEGGAYTNSDREEDQVT